MADSDMLGRVEALEMQVQELKSVQDLLMRLLSTTRPLANLLEYLRRHRRGGTGVVQPARRAPRRLARAQAAPSDVQLLPDAAGRDFPGASRRPSLRADAHRHDEGRSAGVP